MATAKERILVTLTPDMARDIKAIAKREKAPKAAIASRLIREALEEDEDRLLSTIADSILEDSGPLLGHDEFWKQVEEGWKNNA